MTDRERLAEIWCGFLGVSTAADEQNFFGCGGDSMMAVELIYAVYGELGVTVPPGTIFTGRTFGALCASVAAARVATA